MIANSTGTITTATVDGGLLDMSKSTNSRTISTLKVNAGGKFAYDPAVVTVTTKSDPDDPVSISVSRAS